MKITDTVLSLFESSALTNPNLIAIKLKNDSLTFAELNEKSNCFAKRLLDVGIGEGDLIPVIVEDGINVVVSYLSIMKTGAAFIPIDKAWPQKRIALLLSQLKSKCVIVDDAKYGSTIDESIILDYRKLNNDKKNLDMNITSDHLIYGFFTSGTTGVPKCALNYHKGIVNRLLYMNKFFDAKQNTIILQNSKFVFDSSIWQIFWPLINGNSVILSESKEGINIGALLELISKEKINMTDFVPSIFNLLVDFIKENQEYRKYMSTIENLLIGGEEISPKHVYEFLALFPHIQLVNTYGPTEASIGVMFYKISAKKYNPIPIGRPIDNTFVKIIDKNGNDCKEGEVGEICIGGICLGAGYLNQPEKTRLAFIEHLDMATQKKICLYKTGDNGFIGANGEVFFVGRSDNQVKYAGIRIELGEIEQALQSFPAVRKAAVLLIKNDTCDELVAFIKTNGDVEIDIKKLNDHVSGMVAKQVIPGSYFVISEFPLNHNGKLDRKQLEKIYQDKKTDNREDALFKSEEGTKTEQNVLKIYSDMLGRTVTDANATFSQLGGNSLLLTKCFIALESFFQKVISFSEFIEDSCAKHVAQMIERDDESIDIPQIKENFTLIEDISLDNSVDNNTTIIPEKPLLKKILLTGSTGYLGAHLLREILNSTNAQVFCLVRGHLSGADEYFHKCMKKYNIDISLYKKRIILLEGEANSRNFKLQEELYSTISQEIDSVIHCAEKVSFFTSYSELKENNVDSIKEVLRFASVGNLKWVMHISSTSVQPHHRLVDESEISSILFPPEGGYNQTKLVEEYIVRIARERKIPVSVCRFSELFPSMIGKQYLQSDSILSLFINACIETGYCPDYSIPVSGMPINDAVVVLMNCLRNSYRTGQDYNIQREEEFYIDVFLESVLPDIKRVNAREFKEKIEDSKVCGCQANILSVLMEKDLKIWSWFFYMGNIKYENTVLIPENVPLIKSKYTKEYMNSYYKLLCGK